MHLGTQHRLPSRVATRVFLLLALFAASLALTHCRMVGDRLSGVDVNLLRRKNECTAKCQDAFKACNQAEDRRHEAAVVKCAGDFECLANENTLYLANLNECKRLRDICINACHEQGGGTVGP